MSSRIAAALNTTIPLSTRPRGLFFNPQKDIYLGHCARDKAGIGWDGWKDADLYTYQTEVVKESEL